MQYKVISFYRYIQIKQPEKLCQQLKKYCEEHQILGRILIAIEGINGAVSGKTEEVQLFKKYLEGSFPNLTFREQSANENTYHKLVVRVRSEIVRFGLPVNFQTSGEHLAPAMLKQWYDTHEDFVIVDARNGYEYDVGRFKNAVRLPLTNFREFGAMTKQLEQYKEKKMVLYCTGGIRCEKASAYLKGQGFEHVYQVEGGIINYVNQFPHTKNSPNYWEGGLFVFDDRLVSDVGETITTCTHCKNAAKQYYNCHNLDCDKLFICCVSCEKKMKSCCSEECRGSVRQRTERRRAMNVIGRVENYYARAKVALMRVECQDLCLPTKIMIKGKTTSAFEYELCSAQDNLGNSIQRAIKGEEITFSLDIRVRKNDCVFISL